MRDNLSIINRALRVFAVIAGTLFCSWLYGETCIISCCSLVVPLSAKDAVLSSKEAKIINHNLKKAAAQIDAVRQQVHILPDKVVWNIPNALLRACNIPLPGYCCDADNKAKHVADRVATIVLDDFGNMSDQSSQEMVKFLKKINKHKLLFDQRNVSVVCWINGLVLIHEKGDVCPSTDRIIVALKVASRENKLDKIIADLNARVGESLGIPVSLQVASVPLAIYNKLDRSQALELLDKLNGLKNILAFDKKPFRLDQLYIKQVCQNSGIKMVGPWDIQNFSHMSK